MRRVLQAPEATAVRGATAATLSRNATKTESAVARANSPLRAASMPSGGLVAKTRPPAGGRLAIAVQGIETSRASGAPETSGAVTLPIRPSDPVACGRPSDPVACGQRIVAVVWRTGSSGASAHSTTPASPAITATNRAIRLDCARSLGTRVDGRRN